jgi:hypothetical protein
LYQDFKVFRLIFSFKLLPSAQILKLLRQRAAPVLDPYPVPVQDTDRESSVPDWYESVLFDVLNPDPE